jgi:hypothetical protein
MTSNRYWYANGQPIEMIDPDGGSPLSIGTILSQLLVQTPPVNVTASMDYLDLVPTAYGFSQGAGPSPPWAETQSIYESGSCIDPQTGLSCHEADLLRRTARDCDNLPHALTVSFNASAGAITANGFSADFVFNVVSGQSTLFFQTSVGVGVNFSAQAGFTFGAVYGIGGDNSHFQNLTSSISAGVGPVQFQTQSFQSDWGSPFATLANASAFAAGLAIGTPTFVLGSATVGTSTVNASISISSSVIENTPFIRLMYDNLRSRHSACQQAAAALAMLSK